MSQRKAIATKSSVKASRNDSKKEEGKFSDKDSDSEEEDNEQYEDRVDNEDGQSDQDDDGDSYESDEDNDDDATNNIYDDDEEAIPLYERLNRLQEKQANNSFKNITQKTKKVKKVEASHSSRNQIREKKDKNAPATCRSNRPVPILRDTAFSFMKPVKHMDPRFSDAAGKLNYDKFMKNYSFLDENQEKEIDAMDKQLKKTKNVDMKEKIKKQLDQSKQQMIERRRKLKVNQKVKEIYSQEMEKVKSGKQPFFLKKSAIRDIALEQRYDELKKDGKLNHFLAKKRKRNASKDHKLVPRRRLEQ